MKSVEYGPEYPYVVEPHGNGCSQCYRVVHAMSGKVQTACYLSSDEAFKQARILKRADVEAEVNARENDLAVRCLNTGAQCGPGDFPWPELASEAIGYR